VDPAATLGVEPDPARPAAGHPTLTTVAVAVRAGRFVLRESAGIAPVPAVPRTGEELAATLTPLPLFGGDLRLWLRWPDDPSDRRRLEGNLAELAETTGATVWAPATGGRAVVLPGCRDLAARTGDAEVGRWHAHQPPGAGAAAFTSDLDGRLVPAGGVHVAAAGGVPVVSVAADDEARLLERYATVGRRRGLFLADVALLDDGRLAARHTDGGLLALGGRETRRLLRRAGWTDEDVCLLTAVPAQPPPALSEHLTALVAALGVAVWTAEPGSTVVIQDGVPRATDGAGRSAGWLPTEPAGSVAPTRWCSRSGRLVPAGTNRAAHDPPAPPVREALPPRGHPPSMAPPGRPARPHGVPWLPDRVAVNEQPVRLYVASPWPPERVATEGLPSADLFLTGHLDGERLARSVKGGYLMLVQARPGAVAALAGIHPYAPPALWQRLLAPDAYLLPAGWLDRVAWQAGYAVDASGHATFRTRIPATPVVLRCTGARHGTDGLPDEVVPWLRSARPVTAYALVTGVPDDDFLRLYARRPAPVVPGRLLRLRVDGGRVVDVPASAARIAPLTSVRSRLAELRADGVELLLPMSAFGRARVTGVFLPHGGGWRAARGRATTALTDVLAGAGP